MAQRLARGAAGARRRAGGGARAAAARRRRARAAGGGGGGGGGNSDLNAGDVLDAVAEVAAEWRRAGAQAARVVPRPRKVLRELSSFKLALAELAAIAGFSALGTVVEQGEDAEFYLAQYGEAPLFGVLDGRALTLLGADHVYTSAPFLALLGLLAASLAACSATNQWPMVKVARRWRFLTRPADYLRMKREGSAKAASAAVVGGAAADLGEELALRGYEVFLRDGGEGGQQGGVALYAFKGLAGRLAPIGVHISMLLIMGGAATGALAGAGGEVLVPEGGAASLAATVEKQAGPLAHGGAGGAAAAEGLSMRIEGFEIEYTPEGKVSQFYSDLAVVEDLSGRALARKRISVNDPLRVNGLTLYQTSWAMDGLRVRVDGADRALRLPMADLAAVPAFQQANGGSDKTWGTFVPAPGSVLAGERKGATVVAKDMQQVFIYGDDGQFVGVRRLASKKPIEAGGMQLVVEGLVGASGVQVKADPGVPYVYAGFAGLMATTILSYASHSQVWALQTRGEEGGEEEDGVLLVGGRSNRARLGFAEELQTVVGALPARSSATEVSNVQQ